jgi:hypothetical protein
MEVPADSPIVRRRLKFRTRSRFFGKDRPYIVAPGGQNVGGKAAIGLDLGSLSCVGG